MMDLSVCRGFLDFLVMFMKKSVLHSGIFDSVKLFVVLLYGNHHMILSAKTQVELNTLFFCKTALFSRVPVKITTISTQQAL
jgi:hypothetical protein